MTTAVKVIYVDAQNLGVLPPNCKEDGLYQVDLDEEQSKPTIVRIKLDDTNQYTIAEPLVKTHSHFQVYDNNTLILEWNSDEDGTLVIQSHTEKQVNLFAALKAKTCLIKAIGPLFINGALAAESTITIDAEALWFSESIEAVDCISLNVQKGVGFFAPVKAKKLTINAVYVHQEADFQISELLDVSTQFYKQNSVITTKVNFLQLIADQCEMKGDLTFNSQCKLTAHTLILGDDTAQTTFRVLGDSYIQTDSLHLKGDTQLNIKNPEVNKMDASVIKDLETLVKENKSVFVVGKEWIVDEPAAAFFRNIPCFTPSINNQGQLSFEGCTLKSQNIEQRGIIDFKQSAVLICREFSQRKKAITELDNCSFTAPITHVYSGKFNVTQCFYKGEICKVYTGSLMLISDSRLELKILVVDTKAQAKVNKCQVKAEVSIVAFGSLSFDFASITTSCLKTHDGTFKSNNSKVIVDDRVLLSGETDLIESQLHVTNGMTIEGALTINKAQLNADFLELKLQRAMINSLASSSRDLRLHGSEMEDQVTFHDAAILTQIMTCIVHVTFSYSVIYGVSERKITHDLRGSLKLKNSNFITEENIRLHQNGTLKLEGRSFLKVGNLDSQGALKAKDSVIFCGGLSQENANAEFVASDIHIERRLTARTSKIEFKKGARLTTSMPPNLLDKSELKFEEESALTVKPPLINDYSFSDELKAYDKFAPKSTNIAVDRLIALAAQVHAQLDNTNQMSDPSFLDLIKYMIKPECMLESRTTSELIFKEGITLDEIHINALKIWLEQNRYDVCLATKPTDIKKNRVYLNLNDKGLIQYTVIGLNGTPQTGCIQKETLGYELTSPLTFDQLKSIPQILKTVAQAGDIRPQFEILTLKNVRFTKEYRIIYEPHDPKAKPNDPKRSINMEPNGFHIRYKENCIEYFVINPAGEKCVDVITRSELLEMGLKLEGQPLIPAKEVKSHFSTILAFTAKKGHTLAPSGVRGYATFMGLLNNLRLLPNLESLSMIGCDLWDDSDIKSLISILPGRVSLNQLNLDHNHIIFVGFSNILQAFFNGVAKLTTLSLRYNKIEIAQTKTLRGLKDIIPSSLKSIMFEGNRVIEACPPTFNSADNSTSLNLKLLAHKRRVNALRLLLPLISAQFTINKLGIFTLGTFLALEHDSFHQYQNDRQLNLKWFQADELKRLTVSLPLGSAAFAAYDALRSECAAYPDIIRYLQGGITVDTLPAEISNAPFPRPGISDQDLKHDCKQFLYYRKDEEVPVNDCRLKGLLAIDGIFKSPKITKGASSYLFPENEITLEQGYVYLIVKKKSLFDQHARVAYEYLTGYGQHVIRVAELKFDESTGITTINFNGAEIARDIPNYRRSYSIGKVKAPIQKIKKLDCIIQEDVARGSCLELTYQGFQMGSSISEKRKNCLTYIVSLIEKHLEIKGLMGPLDYLPSKVVANMISREAALQNSNDSNHKFGPG